MRTARPGAGADAGQGIVGPIRLLAREFTRWRMVYPKSSDAVRSVSEVIHPRTKGRFRMVMRSS